MRCHPPPPNRRSVSRFSIHHGATLALAMPGGDAGIVTTLWAMKACVDDALEHRGPAALLGEMFDVGEPVRTTARKIYEFLRKHVLFKRDPAGIEHVRHPDQLAVEVENGGIALADCDDVATFGATLARAAGLTAFFVVVSTRPAGEFHHVFFGVTDERGLPVYLDPQERIFDRLPDALTRKMVFDL